MNYNVQRGLRELLNEHHITTTEWKTVLDHFDSRCAFCGIEHTGNNRTGLVPDHLIAAAQYGSLALGNTVPACQDCNDHRGDADWEAYLKIRFPKEANRRIALIRQHLGSHPYNPIVDPAHVLTAQELAEYQGVWAAWEAVWKRACALRDAIKSRRLRLKATMVKEGGHDL